MSEVVDVSSVSEKGQVTIPKQVRDLLGVKPGDRIAFMSRGTDIVMKKARNKRLSETLSKQEPLGVRSLAFQRKARQEWNS
ncbi:MAG: AbrB/MazE/SpoVT family DNA-binding domain-containing protein [Nitrososphaerales archaeon]